MTGSGHGAAAPVATNWRANSSFALGLALPVVLAGLAFVSVSWLPPTYRASLLMTGEADFARSVCIHDLAASDGRDAGLGLRRLVGWFEGGQSLAMLGMRETGLRAVGDRSVELWVQDGEADASRRQVTDLARSIARCVGPSQPPRPSGPAEPADVGAVAQGPAAATGDRDGATVERLRAQLEEAQSQRDSLRSRASSLGPSEAPVDATEANLAEFTARARALEDRTRSLQRAIGDLEAGRAASADEVAASVSDEWNRYQAARSRRDDLQAGIRTMAETLLGNHPRMTIARLRLSELQANVDASSRDLLRGLRAELARQRAALADARERETALAASRERKATEDAERAATQAEEAVAEALVMRLEAALADVEGQATTAPAAIDRPADPAPDATSVVRPEPSLPQVSEVSVVALSPPVWPAVIGAASVGLALSFFGLATAGRRREGGVRAASLGSRRARSVGETAVCKDGETGDVSLEIATIDDVIEALMTSGISRVLLVQAAPAARPLGVDIIRRLALRGQAAAIVDLSEDQAAARAMGAGPDAPGLGELIEGEATFAAIARRDFATRADVIPGGHRAPSSRIDLPGERRNALDFIERSYEILIVDCGRREPSFVRELVDNDAALLLATQGGTPNVVQGAVEALREAGLDEVILVGEAG